MDVDSIMFFSQYLNIVLSLDITYEFIGGMIILYLMYWSYNQMDVLFF